MAHIVLAGATGYLGRYLAQQFYQDGHQLSLVLRDREKLERLKIPHHKAIQTDFSNSAQLQREIARCDIVVSSLGITRQHSKLKYKDVDYAMNARLLDFALKAKAKQFMYISVLHAEKMTNRLCRAKAKFTRQLKSSNIDYKIIRPSGFFSDIQHLRQQCDGKFLPILGDEQHSLNPIHGKDLAKFCAEALTSQNHELAVGGPVVYNHRQLAELIQKHCQATTRIWPLPSSLQRTLKTLCRWAPERWTGAAEFILEAAAMDMAADNYGDITLERFLSQGHANRDDLSYPDESTSQQKEPAHD